MTAPAAGWYPDPQNAAAGLRWWDGGAWTDATRLPDTPAPAAWSPPVPAAAQAPVAWGAAAPAYAGAPAWQGTADAGLDRHYQERFAQFDRNGSTASWNWPAFLFGGFWYLVKGMWIKALLIFFLAFISAGLLSIPLWIYAGMMGNYDFYLLRRQRRQLW